MKLAAHYHRPDMSADLARSMLEDMLHDLAKYDHAQIERACMQWRTSTERFFPTSGQLIALIEPKSTWDLPPSRRERFTPYPEPATRPTLTVAQVLRKHGYDAAASKHEAWAARKESSDAT